MEARYKRLDANPIRGDIMEFLVRCTTGGTVISYGKWLGCAWWEYYTVRYR